MVYSSKCVLEDDGYHANEPCCSDPGHTCPTFRIRTSCVTSLTPEKSGISRGSRQSSRKWRQRLRRLVTQAAKARGAPAAEKNRWVAAAADTTNSRMTTWQKSKVEVLRERHYSSEGARGANSDDCRVSLALCLLCG